MNYLFMETMAIYKATLKLIQEGKIGFISMAEIGYHARVSASAIETLFENREQLISSLGEHVFGNINAIIARNTQARSSFEQRYFRLCDALISHYRDNAEVVPFLDHYGNFPFNVDSVKALESEGLCLLSNFFSDCPLVQSVSPVTVATLFHKNIKIIARSEGLITDHELTILTRMFFRSLDGTSLVSAQRFEAA